MHIIIGKMRMKKSVARKFQVYVSLSYNVLRYTLMFDKIKIK